MCEVLLPVSLTAFYAHFDLLNNQLHAVSEHYKKAQQCNKVKGDVMYM